MPKNLTTSVRDVQRNSGQLLVEAKNLEEKRRIVILTSWVIPTGYSYSLVRGAVWFGILGLSQNSKVGWWLNDDIQKEYLPLPSVHCQMVFYPPRITPIIESYIFPGGMAGHNKKKTDPELLSYLESLGCQPLLGL